MAETDKPFVTYRTGFGLSIKPRSAFGWWATLGWTALTAPLAGGFAWIMASHPSDRQAAIATIGFVLGLLVWSLAMGFWMYRRSEVIDLRTQSLPPSDKLFVCYRMGRRYRFVPRGATGWIALAAWIAPFVLYAVGVGRLAPRLAGPGAVALHLALVFGPMLLWFWALLRWLKPRSEMVYVDRERG